jgi:hypothetical protein
MFPIFPPAGSAIPAVNQCERIPYTIFGADLAAVSQGNNLNREKIDLAWREALSLWGTATPLDFRPANAGEEPLLQIRFEHSGSMGSELGTTLGHISRTPSGPFGSADIIIALDNNFFIYRQIP